jgi:hypothetical protein
VTTPVAIIYPECFDQLVAKTAKANGISEDEAAELLQIDDTPDPSDRRIAFHGTDAVRREPC